jgi:HAD superfamily hydrolase (TIGR01549 family)
MIKAVIFDVDGVLVDSLEANFKFFADLMAKFGYGFMKPEEYAPLFHLPMKDIIRHVTQSNNEEEIEKIWLSGKKREVPYPTELLSTPEYVEQTLGFLSKNYTLAIVTSRSRSGIYSMPQLDNLKQYFKIDIAYEDTKEHKPHPAPLLLASEKLSIKPEECVYVGDSETDILSAKAAGMNAIVFSKTKHPDADACTSVFSELPDLIGRL